MIAATYGVPQTAPGLLAWIDSAAEWELNRRRAFDYPLLPPESAIDPSEDEVSIDAAIGMRAAFAQDSPAVLALFDATATPISKVLLCACSCGWWSNTCVRTAQVQAPRRASAP